MGVLLLQFWLRFLKVHVVVCMLVVHVLLESTPRIVLCLARECLARRRKHVLCVVLVDGLNDRHVVRIIGDPFTNLGSWVNDVLSENDSEVVALLGCTASKMLLGRGIDTVAAHMAADVEVCELLFGRHVLYILYRKEI